LNAFQASLRLKTQQLLSLGSDTRNICEIDDKFAVNVVTELGLRTVFRGKAVSCELLSVESMKFLRGFQIVHVVAGREECRARILMEPEVSRSGSMSMF
jgi:hypothetical protein